MEGMNMAVKAVPDISSYSQDIATVSEDFSDIYYRLEDICHELRALRDSVVFSSEELDEALSRLDLIDSLKKKYGNTIDEILEYQAKLAEDLAVSENFDETKNSLMERAQRIEGYTYRRLQAYTSTRKKGFRAGPGYTEGASRSQF